MWYVIIGTIVALCTMVGIILHDSDLDFTEHVFLTLFSILAGLLWPFMVVVMFFMLFSFFIALLKDMYLKE